MKELFYFLLTIFILTTYLSIIYHNKYDKYIGQSCGGFAANLKNNQCPSSLKCVLNNSQPDSGGSCQYIWNFK